MPRLLPASANFTVSLSSVMEDSRRKDSEVLCLDASAWSISLMRVVAM